MVVVKRSQRGHGVNISGVDDVDLGTVYLAIFSRHVTACREDSRRELSREYMTCLEIRQPRYLLAILLSLTPGNQQFEHRPAERVTESAAGQIVIHPSLEGFEALDGVERVNYRRLFWFAWDMCSRPQSDAALNRRALVRFLIWEELVMTWALAISSDAQPQRITQSA
jgi:hypothetical protein